MAIDTTIVVRNDFKEVHNKDKAKAYALRTIDQLRKNFLIPKSEIEYYEKIDNWDDETYIELPNYEVTLRLFNGFWEIDPCCKYHFIVMHSGDYFWLRRVAFDIAKALGQNEAWYAEEFYTWNSNVSQWETGFENWHKYLMKAFDNQIPEFDQTAIMAQGEDIIPDYDPVYHDSFKECHELFDSLQSKIKGYRLLGLSRVGNGFLNCEKDGKLYLIKQKTLKPTYNEPLDGILKTLYGDEFIGLRDGLQAVFDGNCKQLTDFVEGQFEWKRDPKTRDRIIYNKIAGIELAPMEG
ncbi:MAG: hypothetical protein J5705_01080 [Bacteroidaceae bacterium]|nr:hypothetical protein [Bacteroidaceae bacterium]